MGKGVFDMWLKMSEVAKELGVSKEVVKYHRKTISEEFIERKNGIIYISGEGVEWIKSRLKKESYNSDFEKYTRSKLKEISSRLDWINQTIYFMAHNESELVEEKNSESESDVQSSDLSMLIEEQITDDFKEWYASRDSLGEWGDWQRKFITLEEFLLYLKEKNNN